MPRRPANTTGRSRHAARVCGAKGRLLGLLAGLTAMLSGCLLGPDYRRPEVNTPSAWRFEQTQARQWADGAWWRQLRDPVLDALVQEALQQNLDLHIAMARIEELTGRYRVSRAALWPQVAAEASAGRARASESGAAPFSSLVANPAGDHDAALFASWEIDLWGRLRRASEAAQADVLASEEARRGVVLSLVSSVAAGYVNLRSLDRQLEISRRTVQARQESYGLFRMRFEAGVKSQLELSQVRSELEATQATIPPLEAAIAQQEHALCLLLGRNPGSIARGQEIDALELPAVPAGVPSALLTERPDIRQAEQALIAANARIGVARAAYFPAISLTGALGSASAQLSDLFSGPARTWSWVAPLSAPIFTAGAIAGDLAAAEAIQRQALERYRQAIQAAFRDVEDALVSQQRTREQLAIQERQMLSLGDYARLARLRYDNGYTSYIEVLDAERSLFSAELGQTQSRAALFVSLVNLYKAMGRGWMAESDPASQP